MGIVETTQEQELERSSSNLKLAVLDIYRHATPGSMFTQDGVIAALRERGLTFRPDSPRRVMSKLRREGKINYRIESRSQGLWQWLSLAVKHA